MVFSLPPDIEGVSGGTEPVKIIVNQEDHQCFPSGIEGAPR